MVLKKDPPLLAKEDLFSNTSLKGDYLFRCIDLANVNILEPKHAVVVLELDLTGGIDGDAAIPV